MEHASQQPEARWAPWRLPLALVIAAALLVGGALAMAAVRDREPAGGHAATAGPLDLDTVDHAVAEHYRFAEAHPDVYEEVPCFCGCEDFLDHRHLGDCFVLADGSGYEPHAAGCGVCIAESAMVRDLLEDGADPATIPAAVIARFGTTPPTAPTA